MLILALLVVLVIYFQIHSTAADYDYSKRYQSSSYVIASEESWSKM